MNIKEIGHTLRDRRKFLGKNQSNLSDIVGISHRSLVDIESGKANPTIEQLSKILDALGLTLNITIEKDES
jgi:y4mF family transcriptional regulator